MVLLAARVNAYDVHTSIGKTALARRLVAVADRVVWHDGETTATWTLPDQPTLVGVPVLASVTRVQTWSQTAEGPTPESYLLLLDATGRTLARLAIGTWSIGATYEPVDLERIWPESAFDALRQRGVAHITEEFPALDDLERAHPGAVPRSRRALGSRRSMRISWAFLATATVVALVYAWTAR